MKIELSFSSSERTLLLECHNIEFIGEVIKIDLICNKTFEIYSKNINFAITEEDREMIKVNLNYSSITADLLIRELDVE